MAIGKKYSWKLVFSANRYIDIKPNQNCRYTKKMMGIYLSTCNPLKYFLENKYVSMKGKNIFDSYKS
jgi:hypothetical protein